MAGPDVVTALDLTQDVVALTAALVDVASVSGDEAHLADLVEAALQAQPRLEVERDGNVVVARTTGSRAQRIVLAGHLDTVPIADNVPSRLEDGVLHGCGSADMKSGVAVMLRLAHLVGTGAIDPRTELTWIAYDCEEVEAARNGLGRLARTRPELLAGDLAILLEGTDGIVEGGCQGTLRVEVTVPGERAHSARSWLGVNAVHAAAPLLQRLADYEARVVEVEGLTYREGLNAVRIEGGIAGNVIPDACTVTVNFRFAPDRDEAAALAHVESVLAGWPVRLVDSAPGARPGLDAPLARALVDAVGGTAKAKLGWTDVARFGPLGVPAVNLGPGDPNLAHTRHEHVRTERIEALEQAMVRFLVEG